VSRVCYGQYEDRQEDSPCRVNWYLLYLAEQRRSGFLIVHQGGGGHTASYELSSGLCSRVLPGYFEANNVDLSGNLAGNQSVANENFRAEETQSKNSDISSSDQSGCKGIGVTPRANLSFEYGQESVEPSDPESTGAMRDERRIAQREAVRRHIEETGFEATPNLLENLSRKARE
jgi:hypothetical protein